MEPPERTVPPLPPLPAFAPPLLPEPPCVAATSPPEAFPSPPFPANAPPLFPEPLSEAVTAPPGLFSEPPLPAEAPPLLPEPLPVTAALPPGLFSEPPVPAPAPPVPNPPVSTMFGTRNSRTRASANEENATKNATERSAMERMPIVLFCNDIEVIQKSLIFGSKLREPASHRAEDVVPAHAKPPCPPRVRRIRFWLRGSFWFRSGRGSLRGRDMYGCRSGSCGDRIFCRRRRRCRPCPA